MAYANIMAAVAMSFNPSAVVHAKRDCSERQIELSAPNGSFGAQNEQPLVEHQSNSVESTSSGIRCLVSMSINFQEFCLLRLATA